jgi:hypothetical protein
MFRQEREGRGIELNHDSSGVVISIRPEYDPFSIGGSMLGAIFLLTAFYRIVTTVVDRWREISVDDLFEFGILFAPGLLFFCVGFPSTFSTEEVRVDRHNQTLAVTTRLFSWHRTEQFALDEITDLRLEKSNWSGMRQGIEFHRGKWGYRFALGASIEERERIVNALHKAGIPGKAESIST